jgi:hypothetical protein
MTRIAYAGAETRWDGFRSRVVAQKRFVGDPGMEIEPTGAD